MPNDRSNRRRRHSCISLGEDRRWTAALDISEGRFRQHVNEHGHSAEKARAGLGKAA